MVRHHGGEPKEVTARINAPKASRVKKKLLVTAPLRTRGRASERSRYMDAPFTARRCRRQIPVARLSAIVYLAAGAGEQEACHA